MLTASCRSSTLAEHVSWHTTELRWIDVGSWVLAACAGHATRSHGFQQTTPPKRPARMARRALERCGLALQVGFEQVGTKSGVGTRPHAFHKLDFQKCWSARNIQKVGICQEGPAALRGLASALKALSKARRRMEGGGGRGAASTGRLYPLVSGASAV